MDDCTECSEEGEQRPGPQSRDESCVEVDKILKNVSTAGSAQEKISLYSLCVYV